MYVCVFNDDDVITLNGKSLKFVEIWLYGNLLSDKIKQEFFESLLLYSCTMWTLMKCLENKWDGNNTKILSAILNKSCSCIATYFPSCWPSSKKSRKYWTLLKKKGQTHQGCSIMDSFTWTHQFWLISKNLHSLALGRHWVLSR